MLDRSFNTDWNQIEKEFLPLIQAKARRFERMVPGHHFDFDDAVQEGRLFLFEALKKYDKKRGGLLNFVNVLVDNRYKTMIGSMHAQCRVPNAYYIDEQNKWAKGFVPFIDLDEIEVVCGEEFNVENAVRNKQLEQSVYVFNERLKRSLNGLNRKVFECIVNPPLEFLRLVQKQGGNLEKPTCKQIAAYTGAKVEAVLWSISYIRMKFTQFSKGKEYEELFGDLVRPIFYVSEKEQNCKFIKNITKERGLDLVLKGTISLSNTEGDYLESRIYSWGDVLFLKYNGKTKTVLAQGKFNLIKGILISENGLRERIPVSWYSTLVKRVRNEIR